MNRFIYSQSVVHCIKLILWLSYQGIAPNSIANHKNDAYNRKNHCERLKFETYNIMYAHDGMLFG